jgi:thiol-disulfide isomerase/thioredoxin
MDILIFLATLLLVFTSTVHADDEREVHGRVVDQSGQPVPSATTALFWGGNGKRVHDDGTPLDPTKNKDDGKLFWKHEGEMEPFSYAVRTAQTDSQGRFTIMMSPNNHTIMAMDASRQRGGLGSLTKGQENGPVEIRLGPLVRIHGTFKCAETDKTPTWSVADLCTADDPTRPIDNTRLAACGSDAGRFSLSVPPGSYDLYVYGTSADNGVENVKLTQPIKLDLHADKSDVDLGEIRLPPYVNKLERIRKAKADGTTYDYTKHYGEPPPPWNIVDARGVNKDVQIADYKGKWVLLTFWGITCPFCLREDLPRLMEFYEAHQAQRDQFEILSICIDTDGESKNLAEFDKRLDPIVKYVWDGKTILFPILFDPSYETFETFGLPGFPTEILVDPDGKMVAGDDTTLAEKLK